MTEVRVAHALGREGARQRLQTLAQTRGFTLTLGADGFSGTVEKAIPLLGAARGSFVIEERALVVRVLEAPRFVSEATLRRTLEDELGRLLA